jgi:hypothetical protein
MDCALLTKMSGLAPAFNLRELRDRLTVCSHNVLYHHLLETRMRPTFDDPEYRNDFAVWAKESLVDSVLAERLGIIDPYDYESAEGLRQLLLDVIEDRLGELSPWVPTARPGNQFFFMEATTIAFDTQQRVYDPSKLARALRQMTNGSVYFHFLEARRRPPRHIDDFTLWLGDVGEEGQAYQAAIANIDFYFKSLATLREELSTALDSVEQD